MDELGRRQPPAARRLRRPDAHATIANGRRQHGVVDRRQRRDRRTTDEIQRRHPRLAVSDPLPSPRPRQTGGAPRAPDPRQQDRVRDVELHTPARLTSQQDHRLLDLASACPGTAHPPEAMPPLRRTPMAPVRWRRVPSSPPVNARVAATAMLRRMSFSLLVLAQAAAFGYVMTAKILPYHGREPLEMAIL